MYYRQKMLTLDFYVYKSTIHTKSWHRTFKRAVVCWTCKQRHATIIINNDIPDELVESFNLENSIWEISCSWSAWAKSFSSNILFRKVGRDDFDDDDTDVVLDIVVVHPNVNLHNCATNLEMGEDPTNNFHWWATHSNTWRSVTLSIGDVILFNRSVKVLLESRQWQAWIVLPKE